MPSSLGVSRSSSTPSGGIGWLKFALEENGKGIRAALLHISEQAELKDFCFARSEYRGVQGLADEVDPNVLRDLAISLIHNTNTKPLLLLGLAEDTPPGLFADGLGVRLPCCRIGLTRTSQHPKDSPLAQRPGRHQLLWETTRPGAESRIQRLLRSFQKHTDLSVPFERAEAGLQEAYSDVAVQGMVATGLITIYRLPPVNATQADRHSLVSRLHRVLTLPSRDIVQYQLTWTGELMPFQQEGVQAFLDNHRLLLADDMGLGKTIQAIAALRILKARDELTTCLVAAPASILDQWRREIDKWAPELTAIIIRGPKSERRWQWQSKRDVKLISYDMLRAEYSDRQSPAFSLHWNVAVADEAQRIKNRNETSRALKSLRRTRSWALTGTPIENHEEELASILEFVDHDGRGTPPRYVPGVALRSRHSQLQLRRKKGDVLENLPPKQITMVPIELTPRQRISYDRAERDGIVYLKSLGTEVGIQHVLELITRLKQICNADFQTGESCKLEDIKDRLGQLTAQGHRALIFSQYTSDSSGVAAAANYLRGFNPLTLTGQDHTSNRPAIIEQFKTNDKHKALILSLRVGGLGLNLQEASYVFHLDRWWNPAVERQAEDRTHRMGQTVKVNVIKYSCINTIEQRIDEILVRKQELFDQLVDDVSLSLSAKLTREELFGLFGLDESVGQK